MAEDTTESVAGSGAGSILTRKTGPLPNWVWMAVILLVAIVYALWRKNSATGVADDLEGPAVEEVPGDQTPPPVFILPQNPQPAVNVNITNPVGTPPTAPPSGTKPPVTGTKPTPGAPAKPQPAETHWKVLVAKYTTKNPPWNSTLWGIAKYNGYGSTANNWKAIWNDPRNKSLRDKRKDPTKIQPGDFVYVPKRK